MFVIKRDGREEKVHFDKITSRIKKMCYGLDNKYVDPILVAQKVCLGVYRGVTTTELDELAAETSAQMMTQHPDYGQLAARISISNLHKETSKVFSKTISSLHNYINSETGKRAPLISKRYMILSWLMRQNLIVLLFMIVIMIMIILDLKH